MPVRHDARTLRLSAPPFRRILNRTRSAARAKSKSIRASADSAFFVEEDEREFLANELEAAYQAGG
jgi:hypothetical protein